MSEIKQREQAIAYITISENQKQSKMPDFHEKIWAKDVFNLVRLWEEAIVKKAFKAMKILPCQTGAPLDPAYRLIAGGCSVE